MSIRLYFACHFDNGTAVRLRVDLRDIRELDKGGISLLISSSTAICLRMNWKTGRLRPLPICLAAPSASLPP